MNETENGEIISSKKINDKVQKEYYVIAKNLDIFQQGNSTSCLNEKYSFTCDDHYRRNITVIIDKDNGIKENVEEESVEESIDEEDNAVEDNAEEDNVKKESGKKDNGKKDNGKKK
ncbi:hypothetical protein BDAP_000571 [Binucleata daphniae]